MKIKKYQPTLSLKPTQFAVGVLEVEYKVTQMKALKPKRLAKYIHETPVPVVVSPWQELCITDHHHFVFACWHADIPEVRVDVVHDYTGAHLSYHQFWRKLAKKNQAYLYDQFGEGPRRPLYLPMDIRGMADDPYRSLAWMVRKEGGYENSSKTFAEFQWADFFRAKRLLDAHGRKGFHSAVRRGIRLAHSPAAARFPGYIQSGPARELAEKSLLEKSKYVPKAKRKGPLATVPVMTPEE